MKTHMRSDRGWVSVAVLSFLALVVGLVGGGCDGGSFLDVENEQDLLDRELENPDAIAPVLAGVAGDFAVAYANGAIITGLLAVEIIHNGSYPSWREVGDLGIGSRPSANGNGMYNDFARAVWVSGDAVRRFRKIVENPESSPEIAKAMVWGGFGLLFLADNYCSATFNAGPPVQPEEVYQMAEARFDEALAIAQAAGNNDIKLQAIAGRARARFFQGDYSGALSDAAQIPDGFEFLALYSDNSSREYNDLANMMRAATRKEAGVHPRYYEDPVRIADPRTPWTNWGPGVTGAQVTRQFVQQEKYPSRNSDIPVVNWQEIRLLEAEAELMLGDLDRPVEIINALRTRPGVELAPYDGPMTTEAILEQLMYERSSELWLQGRLLKDMVRMNDPLMQGRDTCFEIGEDEWNTNPNLGGGG